MKRSFVCLCFAAVVASSFGQAVITDGTSSFGWTTAAALSGATNHTGNLGGTTTIFTSNGGVNNLAQDWWWYRANGVNAREFALSTQANAPVVTGNHMVLTYREAEGFTSRLEYTINNIGGTTRVTGTNFVLNEGNNVLDLDFFGYLDMDLANTSTGDSATLLSPNPAMRLAMSDSSGTMNVEWRVLDADAYQVTAFSTLLTSLSDSAFTNLNNTGAPFGPGDVTTAVQWHFTLNPGEEIALQTTRILTPVPEPATMAALGLGIAALLRRRNKK